MQKMDDICQGAHHDDEIVHGDSGSCSFIYAAERAVLSIAVNEKNQARLCRARTGTPRRSMCATRGYMKDVYMA